MWSERYSSIVNSPHGPVQVSDGRLLYSGKVLWTGDSEVGVAELSDDGQTWKWLADIPVMKDHDRKQYHELHPVEACNGRLYARIRNHNQLHAGDTL